MKLPGPLHHWNYSTSELPRIDWKHNDQTWTAQTAARGIAKELDRAIRATLDGFSTVDLGRMYGTGSLVWVSSATKNIHMFHKQAKTEATLPMPSLFRRRNQQQPSPQGPRPGWFGMVVAVLCGLIVWAVALSKSEPSSTRLRQQQQLLTMTSPCPDAATTATDTTSITPALDLGRKARTHLIRNIGSNLDPIVPNPQDDPCTVAIAFGPIVAAQIPPLFM
jgi:hypothetical protein